MSESLERSFQNISLAGKQGVVTGAAQGMGLEITKLLAQRGAKVLALDIDGSRLDTEVRKLNDEGLDVVGQVLDAADPDAWSALAQQLSNDELPTAILVNNAGIVSHRRISQTKRSEWQRVLDINLKGPFLGMQALGPIMREHGTGSIINISSAAGLDQHPDPSYTASKWGLRGLTKTAAQEFGPWGVRVNSIHPGYIDTPMNDFASDALRQAMIGLLPISRAGEAIDIAELVAFLASDAASFITGAEIAIDGGWTSGVQATEARRLGLQGV